MLAAVLAAFTLAACFCGDDASDTTTAVDTTSGTTATETTVDSLADNLLEKNWEGRAFWIGNSADDPVWISYIMREEQTGDNPWEIVTMHDIRSTAVLLAGALRNVHDLEYVDFTKPWRPAFTVEALTVNGMLPSPCPTIICIPPVACSSTRE